MSTVTTLYKGDMEFEAIMGEHRLTVDVSESRGGKGRGPRSTQLFVASLASCVAVFVASYCERGGLDATGLSVDVNYGEDDAEPSYLVDLEVVINLPNAEVGDRLEAIRRVAEHCPVHETVEYNLETIAFEVRDRSTLRADRR
ncbi:MAG TPA: OsmC family protein [Actinomycetota bacterium]|nr:OsmC family protein [Actinomycetota bacterium]